MWAVHHVTFSKWITGQRGQRSVQLADFTDETLRSLLLDGRNMHTPNVHHPASRDSVCSFNSVAAFLATSTQRSALVDDVNGSNDSREANSFSYVLICSCTAWCECCKWPATCLAYAFEEASLNFSARTMDHTAAACIAEAPEQSTGHSTCKIRAAAGAAGITHKALH